MVRFLHTADWQIGMKAVHVASAADRVRRARLETVERLLGVARDRRVDLMLVCGDVFEDNLVDNGLAHEVARLLERAAPLPVFLLSGNHDCLGPGSIYERPVFRDAAPNVRVLREAMPVEVANGRAVLLPCPVRSKQSTADPTDVLAGMGETSAAAVRIGVAHGSLRIPGRYEEDDFPIALDADRRHRLDYLALGHWHSHYLHGERIVYPGTPEPTAFGERDSGTAALVTIEGPGETPVVERLEVASLRWLDRETELQGPPEAELARARRELSELPEPGACLLRLRLTGRVAGDLSRPLEELRDWARSRFLHVALDSSGLRAPVTPAALEELTTGHAFLAGLLADLQALSREQPAEEDAETASERARPPQVQPLPAAVLREALETAGDVPGLARDALELLARIAREAGR